MQDVYKNINDYNPDKENKTLIVFDDVIADIKGLQKLFMVCFLYSQTKFRKVKFYLVAVVMKDPDHDVITCFLLCSVGTLSSFCHEISKF